MSNDAYRCILGVRFFTGTASEAVSIGLLGGLVVVPAAPALVDLPYDAEYREALTNADLVITDSGFMVLLFRILRGERLRRVSGLEYLTLLLARPEVRTCKNMWVMPSVAARDQSLTWLRARGYSTTEDDCYVAPLYSAGPIEDSELLEKVIRQRPQNVVVCLGGGVQERLGLYLKRHLDYRPGIHCIGAAIGFLSGEQAYIPMWADHLFLGWLCRCLHEPRKFLPRYWKARRLLPMMLKDPSADGSRTS